MVSPLLLVFILQVVIHLINTVGATAINELVSNLFRIVYGTRNADSLLCIAMDSLQQVSYADSKSRA